MGITAKSMQYGCGGTKKDNSHNIIMVLGAQKVLQCQEPKKDYSLLIHTLDEKEEAHLSVFAPWVSDLLI